MKRLIFLVVFLAACWSGWWFHAASQQRGAVEAWFEARRADGWQASYDDIAVRGFPNRIDTTISGIFLSDGARGTGWEAPFLQIFQLSYKPGHLILAFPDTQTLVLPDGVYDIASDGLRASLVETGQTLERLNLEATVLNIAGDRSLALAGLNAAVLHQPDDPLTYRVALTAEAMASDRRALPGLPAALDGVRLDARVTFDDPLTRDRLTGGGTQPNAIDLRLAEYRLGDVRLKLAGTVDVANDGTLDGRLTLQAENWRVLVAMAEDAGQLPPAVARTLEQGLDIVASLSGSRDTLDLPLDFDDGRMALGPIPLGPAPRLRLP
ncbi:DUF2125 domain-containing protein [Aestuariicoccus sp. MJ-SS9]|uniref:DUF2125 domain-containing protein n=1 Tax=Aestuariicoccus sp. MJ-SS9 TaxID=3079855 RepID=UPI00290B101E|nr:DUF2125 domain-containing protein [Aestuariicoccus sp. MJ-SS9]MDU8909687.1 DUF2125 domain-containing protein [Aestuariicoccus sp. MJ-SS9]